MGKSRLRIWYDRKGDFLEVRATPRTAKGYFRSLGGEVFARVDSRTKKIVGFAIFNLTKRFVKRHAELALPLDMEIRPAAGV
jgi:hypothetical protein